MAKHLKKHSSKNATLTLAFGIGLVAISLILALGTYQGEDPSFSSWSSTWNTPKNVLGYVGAWVSDALFQTFGFGAWLIPVLLWTALFRWMMKSTRSQEEILGTRWWIGFFLLASSFSIFADLVFPTQSTQTFSPQGLLGLGLGSLIKPFLGYVGTYLAVVALLWAFCMTWWEDLPLYFVQGIGSIFKFFSPTVSSIFTKIHWRNLKSWASGKDTSLPTESIDKISGNEKLLKEELRKKLHTEAQKTAISEFENEEEESDEEDCEEGDESFNANSDQLSTQTSAEANQFAPVIRTPVQQTPERNIAREKLKKSAQSSNEHKNIEWELPPLSLLEAAKKKIKGPTQEHLIETAKKITNALQSFEIEGEVVEISPGPIITLYEFRPAPGIRAQKIVAASTDLAMTLGAPSVRIVAPIPGKSVAGIEVPNLEKEDIVLRDCFELTRERSLSQRLPLVLGKDGEGKAICEDLSRMPHLLVGGATSMGKSVLVNSILTGLLCRFTPEDLKLIIVDPKLVEFKVFEDIPHLLLPIVNDPSDASQALKWAVTETKRRYVLMQKYSAKNLEAYNQKITELKDSDLKEGESRPEKFPYIVIIIDELAELMFTAKKDVEQSIVRLTQLARAAGLHLIMATQRPSADVVTGLIKSNCPSRAALRVSSGSDSRIILDCTGAEQLLGRGDMFFTNTGPMGLKRMQSAFVSDNEIEKICDFWRGQGEPEYREEILAPELPEDHSGSSPSGEVDKLYGEVLEFAKEKGKISTSLIQRRFQIGYSRAARIMEQLEQNGVVGEQQSAGKPREVIF